MCLARSPPPAPVPMEDDRLLEELPVDEHEPESMEVDPVEKVEELLNLSLRREEQRGEEGMCQLYRRWVNFPTCFHPGEQPGHIGPEPLKSDIALAVPTK